MADKVRYNIAVLVACHNRLEKTIRGLRSLFVAEGTARESFHGLQLTVYLVDDGSTDGTSEAVAAAFPRVEIIKADGTLFWAKSMNLAWRQAADKHYDAYLWFNDDVILYPDSITTILGDFTKHPSVIVGACKDPNSGGMSFGASDACDKKIEPCGIPVRADGWLNGNVVLVSSETSELAGIISDSYSHARADYDYAERLRKSGVSFYASSAYVGVCPVEYRSRIKGLPLRQRIQLLWKPCYWNIRDLWIFRCRYYGIMRAIVSCIHLVFLVVKGADNECSSCATLKNL